MRYNTLCIGIFFLALACGMACLTAMEPDASAMDMISPQRITFIFLSLLGGFGALLIGVGLREASRGAAGLGHAGRLGAFLGIAVLYALGLSYVGHYELLTPAMLFASLLLLRVRLVPAVAIAIVFSVVVYLTFHTVLGVPLP